MRTILLLLFFCCVVVHAQTPAADQQRQIVLRGGTVHVGNGTVIENAVLVFENGKLTFAGNASSAPASKPDAEIIDASGKHIYPGFIAPLSRLGLTEIGAVRSTNDYAEVGGITPHVRSLIAYNTDSQIIPTVRSNGILLAQITPAGGTIPGTSSIVQLDAWNWEDAAYAINDGVHLNWPSMELPTSGSDDGKARQRIEKELEAIEQLFAEAQAYSKNPAPGQANLKLEAMRKLFDGSEKLYISTGQARGILAAVAFARRYNITPVIIGGSDAWRVTDVLKQYDIPVILDEMHRLPSSAFEDVDQPYKLPFLLRQAGVRFCISKSGSWEQRNLPFEAGTAAAYGLTREEALAAITSWTAEILGIAKSVGTLETGKDATLFISTGDALDMRTNNVEVAFIRGRKIDLDNKQKALYRKYTTKYGQ
jgi:imidazolonepropionase-like amidohydrolase